MAGETITPDLWPLPKFHFGLSLGDLQVGSFQEISGLELETEGLEYRHGTTAEFSVFRMPGTKNTPKIILKNGVVKKDNPLLKWFDPANSDVLKKEMLTIQLSDESGLPLMKWTFSNAFPTKITGSDLSTDSSEITVESLELAYEVLSMENQ